MVDQYVHKKCRCTPVGASLCDSLFTALAKNIPDLQRSETQRFCGLLPRNGTRFAYVLHSRRHDDITVWCTGDPVSAEIAGQRLGLTVRPRGNPKGKAWDKAFPWRFTLHDVHEVGPAAELVFRESFLPRVERKGPRRFDRPLPEELTGNTAFFEGVKRQIVVNAYERDPEARERCIEYHGASCCICGYNFEQAWGPRGAGFIHVHHLTPLSQIGGGYNVDPVEDLRPVCPNCHAALHLTDPPMAIPKAVEILHRPGTGRI